MGCFVIHALTERNLYAKQYPTQHRQYGKGENMSFTALTGIDSTNQTILYKPGKPDARLEQIVLNKGKSYTWTSSYHEINLVVMEGSLMTSRLHGVAEERTLKRGGVLQLEAGGSCRVTAKEQKTRIYVFTV